MPAGLIARAARPSVRVMSTYAFSPEWEAERQRLACLDALWDRASRRALETAGVPRGAACLDVGAGDGSVARLLAELVGERGRVVALDRDVRFLDPAGLPSTVEVCERDLLTDGMPSGSFDLVHARMVLSHLPERDAVLDDLVSLLAPGGRILLSEFDAEGAGVVEPVPPDAAGRFQRVHDAVVAVLASKGGDSRWAHWMPAALASRGLTGIGAVVDGELVRGATPISTFYQHTFQRLREPMLATTPVTAELFDRVHAALDDPEFVALAAPLVSVWGQRPVEAITAGV
ncbi:methyltransferase domain-containing protein [Saccharopolyspora rosea]